MSTVKHESSCRDAMAVRLRQRQLGRGLRLLYERVLREPVPSDMIDALWRADQLPHESQAASD